MALRYPEDVTGFLGEIHFSPIILSDIIGDALVNNNIVSDIASNSNVSVEDIKSFAGLDPNNQTNRGTSRGKLSEKCILFLPQAITFTDRANYTGVDLGLMGAATEASIKGAPQAGNNIRSFLDNMGGLANKETAKLATNMAIKSAAPAGISGAIRSATRVSVNPNTRTLFESVPIRQFTFSFKLIPHTSSEANTIKQIVKFFRSELYPESNAITVADGIDLQVAYKFPNQFRIEILYDKKPVTNKIKDCYLMDMSTSYNSTSSGLHADGNFNEVDISLTFIESKALTRKDILEGY